MRVAEPPKDRIAVALTFDACPGAFDQRIAAALAQSRIPATIFVTGLWLRRNPVGLAFLLAHRDLFCIENHGENHIPPVLGQGRMYGIPVAGDLATVEQEVTGGAASIRAATSLAPRWYRGATARYSPAALPAIKQLGFGIAGFSLNADMGASLPAHSVADRMAKAAHGDVVIAHINQPNRPSGQGVVDGLAALQRRGVAFLRLDELGTAGLVPA
jgi:peptidoglycan/xylan/chitin deacetylase (PgdA/CDA1 family)